MHSLRRHTLSTSLLALMLYFGPNLVQDIHRVYGHSHEHHSLACSQGFLLGIDTNPCAICVFTFIVTDSIIQNTDVIAIKSWYITLSEGDTFPLKKTFDSHIQARAPPLCDTYI